MKIFIKKKKGFENLRQIREMRLLRQILKAKNFKIKKTGSETFLDMT